jgi:hypothetical protein
VFELCSMPGFEIRNSLKFKLQHATSVRNAVYMGADHALLTEKCELIWGEGLSFWQL